MALDADNGEWGSECNGDCAGGYCLLPGNAKSAVTLRMDHARRPNAESKEKTYRDWQQPCFHALSVTFETYVTHFVMQWHLLGRQLVLHLESFLTDGAGLSQSSCSAFPQWHTCSFCVPL